MAPSFDDFVLDHGIIGFFENAIKLKSGRTSHFYVNWRHATNDAWVLNQLTDYIKAFIHKNFPLADSLYGVPEGATKTAVITSMKMAMSSPDFGQNSHIISMGRSKPKSHGSPEDRFFIGMPQGKTIVLEDTITTGGSLFQTIDQLKAANVNVVGAIGLTDRMEKRDDGLSVKATIESKYEGKIEYHAMSQALTLLPDAAKRTPPSAKVWQALVSEFNEWGVDTLENR